MSNSPFEAYLGWYDALPPELARELATVLMQFFPGDLLTSSLVTTDPTTGLVPRMRRLVTSPPKEVGLVSTLVAITDLAFRERGDPKRAGQTGAMLDVLDVAQETLTSDGSSIDEALAQWVAEQKLRHPLRAKQWSRERDGWLRLREERLGPERLLDFLRGRMLS